MKIFLVYLLFFVFVCGQTTHSGDIDFGGTIFYSHRKYKTIEKADILWPLNSYRRYKNYERWRFLNFYFTDENIISSTSDYHFGIFPLIWGGKSQGGRYGALFPLGGAIGEFWGYDFVSFFLWPFYVQAKKGSYNSYSLLWPFIRYRYSKNMKGYSVFPFYSKTYVKNKHRSYATLWPFFTWGESLNPRSPGYWYNIFPFYGYMDNNGTKKYNFLWPFFLYDRGKYHIRVHFPFPFLTYYRKVGKKGVLKFNIWPLYSQYDGGGISRRKYLWPFFNYEKTLSGKLTHINRSFIPFYLSRRNYKKGEKVTDFWRVWPLLEKDEIKGKYKRYRFPALWPAENTPVIERNINNTLTLYDKVKFEDGSYRSTLFWGIYKNSLDKKKQKSGLRVYPFFDYQTSLNSDDLDIKIWPFYVNYGETDKGTKQRILSFWPGIRLTPLEEYLDKNLSFYSKNEQLDGSYESNYLFGLFQDKFEKKQKKKTWGVFWGVLQVHKSNDDKLSFSLFGLEF